MICPNCGEPVQTRHLFCVVCGADLKDVKPERVSVRLKKALRKTDVKASAAKKDAAAASHSQEPESAGPPELMRNLT